MTTENIFDYRYAPFSDTFEVREPYMSLQDTTLTERSLRFIAQGKSLCLFGNPGSGKSMLLRSIADALDPKMYATALIPYGNIKRNILLRELCEEFNIDISGRGSLLTRLRKYFSGQSGDKPYPVIIIDDAHDMEKESFMDLCTLLHDPVSRTAQASIILCGHTCLKTMLNLDIYAPVRTRLAYLFKMPGLKDIEAVDFIKHRLKIAEVKGDIFDDDALTMLASDAGGNRRELMNLCTLAMEVAKERKERIITADLINNMDLE